MIGLFSSSKKRQEFERHFSALDIGSELVKALIVRKENDAGAIVGVGYSPQVPGAVVNGSITDPEAVAEACDIALKAAEEMAGVVPGRAFVGVSGDLVKGFATSVSYPRQDPTDRITEAELRGVLQIAQKRAVRDALYYLSEQAGLGEVVIKLVHSSVVNVLVDGYPVANPINFQGNNLEVTVFNTFAPLSYLNTVQKVLDQLDLEISGMIIPVFGVAEAFATGDTREGAIFIDIGSSSTHIALARQGGVEAVRAVPLGARAFTKSIAKQLDVSPAQAEEMKLEYSTKKPVRDTSSNDKIANVIWQDTDVFIQACRMALSDLAGSEDLPSLIFLCGGGSLLPELVSAFVSGEWVEQLPFIRTPTVQTIIPRNSKGLFDATARLTSPQDAPVVGIAYHGIYIESNSKDVVNRIAQRVSKATT